MHWRIRTFLERLEFLGLDYSGAAATARGLLPYLRNLRTLRKQLEAGDRQFALGRMYPCFGDRFAAGGVARGHYFHQDLSVARRIFALNPQRHVDIGSRIDGFAAHVASFRPIEIFDIRRVDHEVTNMTFLQADFTKSLPGHLRGYADSASCLHALEHFGLGRYGDEVNVDGHLLGLANLHDLLKTGGVLHLSVPIGPQRIEFDAHRVFSLAYLASLFEGRFDIRRFSFVDDAGAFHEDTAWRSDTIANNCACQYGCGIFELVRR